MQTSIWLSESTERLEKAGIGTARLDGLVLLEDASGKDRGWLLAHPEFELTSALVKKLDKQIVRRASHEPLAYIRGKTEFYGHEFLVNSHTLEPRPETETMIDLVKTYVKNRENLCIADVGTGSGCIAISVKLALPATTIIATDIDPQCVKITRENAKKLQVNIDILRGNLLEPIEHPIDIVLCNLPYVPDSFELNQAATFEPEHAIFGGKDGLDVYRQLFKQINFLQYTPECIMTEALPFQHEVLTSIAAQYGYTLTQTDDFIQVFIHKK